MKALRYLIVITKRKFAQAYLDFFAEKGVERVFARQCLGSANDKILEYMSLERSEKVMFSAFVPKDEAARLKKDMLSELFLGENGNGIALTVPVDGIGGITALRYLNGDKELTEENDMQECNYCLIVSIVNQGFADAVMDAARKGGARGGTILKAKGTGADYARKFFGVSITEEKEIVYVVARKEDRDGIMRAVMDDAGTTSEARGAVFSLPVDSVAGVQSLMNIPESEL